ncbi:putative DNA repair exonuclease [Pseudomonas phage UAntarctica]|nr:putative DNA repair exonuclease [Pseudomonas phage UAntarctica]
MHLISLSTENFKRLGTFQCSFTNGLNVIAGDNARGKSTLLQAISAALFGVTLVPGKKENIPTWGQTKASILLEFSLKGSTYQVMRTLTTAKLTRLETKELVANGNTAVTDAVKDLLGLTANDWDLFIQSKQHEAAGILTFGATALNRKVEEYAGVDLIEKVQAEAQRNATLYSSYAEAKGVSEEDLEQLHNNLAAAEAAEKEAEAALEVATRNLESHPEFSGTLPAVASKTARLAQRDVDRLSNAVDLADAALASAKKRVAEYEARVEGLVLRDDAALKEDLQQLHDEGTIAREEMTRLRTEQAAHVSAQTEFTKADAIFDGLNDAFQTGFREFDEVLLISERDQLDSDYLPTNQAEIDRETEEVGKAKAAYDNLSMLSDGAVCPTCNRAKEDHDPEKLKAEAAEAKVWWENRVARVSQLKQDRLTYDGRRKEIVDQLAAYDVAAKKVDEASATLAVAEQTLKGAPSVADQLKATEEAYETLRTAYAAKQQEIKGVDENNERHAAEHRALEKARTELEICTDTLNDANKALEEAPEPPTDEQISAIEKEEAAYLEARSAWERDRQALTSVLGSAQQSYKYQDGMLSIAVSRLGEANRKVEEAKNDLALSKKYSRLVQFLRDRRQTYLAEIWDTVMGLATRLVHQSSQGTITKLANLDGEFFYEEEGNMTPTPSASGAQKAMIGTSMRVALGRALYGGDSLMIFDEPTESCKEHNAASMAATLATSAKQVLLITHRETDQGLAENIINVGD